MPPDMPAPKLRPVAPDDDDSAAGHVLAAVVADALDHRRGAGVADAEAFADLAAQEDLAARGAVADHVAGDDVVLGRERVGAVGPDDDAPAGQTLADVVVGVAVQAQRDAGRQERPEALAGGAVEA